MKSLNQMNASKVPDEILKTLMFSKTCSCGKVHTKLPADSVMMDPFYWFNCECKSTLVYRYKEFK